MPDHSYDKILEQLDSKISSLGGDVNLKDMLSEVKKTTDVLQNAQKELNKKYKVIVHKSAYMGLSVIKKPAIWTSAKLEAFHTMEYTDTVITLENSNESLIIDYNKDVIDFFNK